MLKKNKFILYGLIFFIQASYAQQQIPGRLSDPVLKEVSGAAASQKHKNIFYVHNDSGDSSRFFAITNTGKLTATYYFKTRINTKLGVLDCEDIAVGPGPVKGQSYIYLADIGDNLGWRPSVQVYRFKEPTTIKKNTDTLAVAVLNIRYPDGPHDAETIMVDAKQQILYIISKREDSVSIYSCPLIFTNNDKVTMQHCGKIYFEGSAKKKWIVSGDITADGTQIILKSLEKVYYWKRNTNEPVYETLHRLPVIQHTFLSHGQEEAIAFAPDGKGYYVMAEGKGSAIYYYTLEK